MIAPGVLWTGPSSRGPRTLIEWLGQRGLLVALFFMQAIVAPAARWVSLIAGLACTAYQVVRYDSPLRRTSYAISADGVRFLSGDTTTDVVHRSNVAVIDVSVHAPDHATVRLVDRTTSRPYQLIGIRDIGTPIRLLTGVTLDPGRTTIDSRMHEMGGGSAAPRSIAPSNYDNGRLCLWVIVVLLIDAFLPDTSTVHWARLGALLLGVMIRVATTRIRSSLRVRDDGAIEEVAVGRFRSRIRIVLPTRVECTEKTLTATIDVRADGDLTEITETFSNVPDAPAIRLRLEADRSRRRNR